MKEKGPMPNPNEGEGKREVEKFPERVYFVESSVDDTVLYAMDVRFFNQDKTIRWFDGTKERIMTAKGDPTKNPDRLVFHRSEEEGGGEYVFSPMTLEVYRAKVRDRLAAKQDFDKLPQRPGGHRYPF